MDRASFEALIEQVSRQLTSAAQQTPFDGSPAFERRTRELLQRLADGRFDVDLRPHPHVFPDICLGRYGIEVKFSTSDTWRSIANSVFESTRDPNVEHVYVLFGKMGGTPAVRWGRYESCVVHVRTSHVPRFEVEMFPEQSLFDRMGVSYAQFCGSSAEAKMQHVRSYARKRLKPGERLWWLEEQEEPHHSLPINVRFYPHLCWEEQRALRAEAAILCPQVVGRARYKYSDAVMYLLTYRGVLCPNARDLFSAGSVALRANKARGGNYVERALRDIEPEMRRAAEYLEDRLFEEYWDATIPPAQRVAEWLARADEFARDWRPSAVLFR